VKPEAASIPKSKNKNIRENKINLGKLHSLFYLSSYLANQQTQQTSSGY
jgi:hypothetical protein